MTLEIVKASLSDIASMEGTLVVFADQNGKFTAPTEKVDKLTNGVLRKISNSDNFSGKAGETAVVPFPAGIKAEKVILVGTGEDTTSANLRKIGGKSVAQIKDASEVHLLIDGITEDPVGEAEIALGAELKSYSFDIYKTKNVKAKASLNVVTSNSKIVQNRYEARKAAAAGVFLTRDLVNEPSNILTPPEFAERAAALHEVGLKVEIINEQELVALGMNALVGVGVGSELESKVAIMRWMGSDDPNEAPVVFVGKGVTFDTGGISLKPAAGMEEMTMDMGGAGVVTGVMKSVAMRKAKANVIGIIGLVENMPDGRAQRPGDIVKSMSGQTIEIINTDAEGRLVLADVLWYAQEKFNPRLMINLATLTGAIIVALGHENAGYFCNNDDLAKRIETAASTESEGIWRMPLGAAYDKKIDCRLADMKNTGGRDAGSITAAQFLQRFVQDGVPWAHIDIAGVALLKEDGDLHPKGATGWGVRTLDRLVADIEAE